MFFLKIDNVQEQLWKRKWIDRMAVVSVTRLLETIMLRHNAVGDSQSTYNKISFLSGLFKANQSARKMSSENPLHVLLGVPFGDASHSKRDQGASGGVRVHLYREDHEAGIRVKSGDLNSSVREHLFSP